MKTEPRRTWPQELPILDRDYQAPIRTSAREIGAPMATYNAEPRRTWPLVLGMVACLAIAIVVL